MNGRTYLGNVFVLPGPSKGGQAAMLDCIVCTALRSVPLMRTQNGVP